MLKIDCKQAYIAIYFFITTIQRALGASIGLFRIFSLSCSQKETNPWVKFLRIASCGCIEGRDRYQGGT